MREGGNRTRIICYTFTFAKILDETEGIRTSSGKPSVPIGEKYALLGLLEQ